ncbi:bleomycin resistance protein [Corynebacterium vitaeruminis]|uniref:bleomycin resistance protein n=1 Tax=Corynebacterium vitaeruminis TaxID=38305 RepID=UPI0028B0A2A0|nr:bleomycin resistance protein [Corynebacterium vitaeruminis]
MTDRATPNLPSRDFTVTSRFFTQLSFTETYRDSGWMILERGSITLEFFPYPDLEPSSSSFGCCLRLDDIDAFIQECIDAGVPVAEGGWPRVHLPRIEPSGMRIGALIDPDCSLLRVVAEGG